MRGQVLQLREQQFVEAARLMGAGSGYIIGRHLLPNVMGVVLVSLTFAIPSAIFTEAFLSFIGMGVAPPHPTVFFENPPHQNRCPLMGHSPSPPHLKMNPPNLKYNLPPPH